MTRLAADAAHEFGGISLERGATLHFRLDGHRVPALQGDTVLSAMLASGVTGYGTFGDTPLGLTARFSPLLSLPDGTIAPMDRVLVADGVKISVVGKRRLRLRKSGSLALRIDGVGDPPWLRDSPTETLTVDLLVVGGGVAGLAAAEAGAQAGMRVMLVERRPRLGGDARYFGPVGDDVSPADAVSSYAARLRALPSVTIMTSTEAFALLGNRAHLHRVADGRASTIAVAARQVVLATGSQMRLPVFGGNRLPGILTAIDAYELAKYYGVAPGASAIVATQSNFGYRLAMRLRDAGVDVRRVADTRIDPLSRFVDFAKASGLTVGHGQFVWSAAPAKNGLSVTLADIGSEKQSPPMEADALIVGGAFQPDLRLWMLAGGGTQWGQDRLMSRGELDNIALVGAAAGYRTMKACIESGRIAVKRVVSDGPPINDVEPGSDLETGDGPTPLAPATPGHPAFYDSGPSLICRVAEGARETRTRIAHAPAIGDVAASVELGVTLPADAGALAEERGAPGADLVASDWTPPTRERDPVPRWLTGRFGAEPVRLHLVMDSAHKFEPGALVYANTCASDPRRAIGVIIDAPPDDQPGGMALMSSDGAAKCDRFIVEELDGPRPARLAKG
jgi:sarcosine oxidase subunit alpha